MKTLIVLITMFFCFGCNDMEIKDESGKTIKVGASVIIVNDCQYIVFRERHAYSGSAMVHAGNCNNKEHTVKYRVDTAMIFHTTAGTFYKTDTVYLK